MAKQSRTGSYLPSKDDLIAFIGQQNGKVGTREIARAFGLKNADRALLKDMLRGLDEEGRIERRRRSLHPSGSLAPVVAAEVCGRDRDGELLATPAAWDVGAQGAAPKIALTFARRSNAAAPGVGDRVLVRIAERRDETDPVRYSGRVIKLLDRARERMLGIFRALPNGGGRLSPIDKRQTGREFAISPNATGDAQDGELVAVDISPSPPGGPTRARVTERLGSLKGERTVSLIAIHAHGLPHVFPPAALAESEAARPAGLAGREDWRTLPLVTIDPIDARDHDDAVHAVADPDPANPGGFVLTVAIADVAHYVRPGSALDREALARGNSVYFPDRVVPMLPERISNDLCSLRPGEDRAAIAVRMVIGADGRKRSHGFHRVLMRSHAKLHYAQAQEAMNGRPDATTGPLLANIIEPLFAAYRAIKVAREVRQPLDLELPERKIVLKADGTVDRVIAPERLDAHRLIEEFMILANVAAAESLEAARTPLIYRVHDEPALEKVEALREFLGTLNIRLHKGAVLRPALFNGVLDRVRGRDTEALVNEVILRAQAQAEYAAENYGHFGLALRRYAHFTSPIRRYADLVVHRALIRALRLGEGGLPESQDLGELSEIAQKISAAERRAMKAERETVDRLIAHFLADRLGSIFEGCVSGVTRAGLFVKLEDTGADGFVPAATLGNDYYRFEENRHALIGQATGESFRLGDKVSVRLIEAAPVAGALRFQVVSAGRQAALPDRRSKRARKPGATTRERPRSGRARRA